MPFQELISSLNPAITNLLAEKNKEMTRSIISLDGTGHYLTLSAAITAGEKYILLKDGEHSISSNITISDQKITGESKRNTILKFTNNSKLIFDSTGNIVNEGGSGTYEIKLAQDDDLITKAGTQDLGFTAVDYDNSWRQVTYGNGIFVAVAYTGTNNRVITSPDGITWTSRTSATENNWLSVTYGNSLFVAVANSGTNDRVMTSPDGITWTSRTSAADNDWLSVTYGNNLFVAVASTGTSDRVMTSPDGITWTSRTSAADNDWESVIYGNSLFVAVADSGTNNRVMTSPDGINWTSRTSAANNNWQSVTYGNSLFVAVANSGTGDRVMTSPDGINWTSKTSAADNNWESVI
jgi:predicted RecA/RadA family phage recombinase